MTGMDCILCNVLWILHLSRKTEVKNTILLAGLYEITAYGNHFWGYVYIYVSMCETERERGELLKYFGGGKTDLLDFQESSRARELVYYAT